MARYRQTRGISVEMCRPLAAEAFRVQPSEEVSPPWWNLGHTSWFFVRAVLEPFGGPRVPEDDAFDFVLNSYYHSLGDRLARAKRGSLSRPTNAEIYAYRESVDRRVEVLLRQIGDEQWPDLALRMTVGINHEQQHQELFYTEIKAILAQNPPHLRTPYLASRSAAIDASADVAGEMRFVEFAGGLFEFGHSGPEWCWDNESPQHKHFLVPFALADRLVTNREYLAFIEDGGYRSPLLWLDNGWQAVQQRGWQAPLYWERLDGQWRQWTLGGWRRLDLDEPACHLCFYEADAFARWRSATFRAQGAVRLPSEREWESAARAAHDEAHAFLDSGRLHPAASSGSHSLQQMFGSLWQWTSSYYEPYPGYQPFAGELAEYNGKFMDNQRVLRGGSCVTPRNHFRVTYRNFWPADARFQFTGIRLAR